VFVDCLDVLVTVNPAESSYDLVSGSWFCWVDGGGGNEIYSFYFT
jgi:hypothetical protein